MMVFEEEAVGGFRCDWWLDRSSSTQIDRRCFGVGRALGLLCTFVRGGRGKKKNIKKRE